MDEILVKKTLSGDKDAFNQLVAKYQTQVYGLAFNICRNFSDAEDLAQEAFIRAYLSLHQLREPASFGNWLYRITQNLCRRWLQNKTTQEKIAEDIRINGMEGHILSPDELAEAKELRERVRDAIEALPEQERLVVTLYYMDGLTQHDIADFVGISESTVRRRLRSSREILKGELLIMVQEDLQKHDLTEEFTVRTGKSLEELEKEIIRYVGFSYSSQLKAVHPARIPLIHQYVNFLEPHKETTKGNLDNLRKYDWLEWAKRYLAKKYLDELDKVTTEGGTISQLNVAHIFGKRDIQFFIHSTSNPSLETTDALYETADTLYGKRTFEEAAELYGKVIEQTGERRAREMIIRCYVELGEHGHALAEFLNIIIDPKEPFIKDVGKACVFYGCNDSAYGWDVSVVPPLFSRTDWLLKVYDISWNSREGELLMVLEDDANLLDDVTRYQMLIRIYASKHHVKRFWRAYKKLLKLSPSTPTSYLEAVRWFPGSNTQAVVDAMLKNVPLNSKTVWYLGKVAEELAAKEFRQITSSNVAIGLAIKIFEEILRPGFEECFFYYRNLAKCYERQNKLDKALEAYKKAGLSPPGWPQETVKRIIETEIQQLGAPQEIISGKDGAQMVLIPAGEFEMGTDTQEIPKLVEWARQYYPRIEADWFERETPRHSVYLDAFYMDVHPVTNDQYRKFATATGHREPQICRDDRGSNQPNQPVVGVHWYDAMAYAKWAGKRLPTEAEWEKAARGGLVGRKYPNGDSISKDDPGFDSNHAIPVKSFPPNGYGLYDMAGNVWEWCLDEHQRDFYKASPKNNPLAGNNPTELLANYKEIETARILRGGSRFTYEPAGMRVAERYYIDPASAPHTVGFRCVQDLRQ